MSPYPGPRGRRSAHAPSGGALSWLLSLPARMHVRWLVILVVTAVVMGAYARVLVTAKPMPPSKVPASAADHGPTPVSSPSPPGASPTPRVG